MNAFLWRTAILLVVPFKIPVEEKGAGNARWPDLRVDAILFHFAP
jgi:hypothetical protein